jgi:tricorn protease
LAALTDANSREDVNFLISEMISELNVGHAYNRGGRRGGGGGPGVGLLGCDWTLEDGAYRIQRLLGAAYDIDARSPLAVQGVDVDAGDWLLAVNGTPVDASRTVYAAFVATAGRETLITVNSAPTFDGNEREVVIEPMRSETSLRYRDWVAGRRAAVAETSGGRIGYVHVPDTGVNGQNELVRQFMAQQHMDALIVDERWNSGGQIPTRFIELLNRPATNFWATRSGRDWQWPPVGHRGPKAMLINHAAGSGGDAFPYYFRQAGLGPLIGTRTWGGLVGMSGQPALIDGSGPTVPSFAFYELDGTWGIEGHGVEPDIEVLDNPAHMCNGEDPQLEAAIEHLLGELENYVPPGQGRPAYPDRSGAGVTEEDK